MVDIFELIRQKCPSGFPVVRLGDIGSVRMCKRVLKSDTTDEGDIPFYKIDTFGGVADAFISQVKYDELREKFSFPASGSVLISAAGTVGKCVIYDGEPAYFQDSNIVWLEHGSEVLDKYLWYCYQLSPWYATDGGIISRLYNDNIEKARIPLPPLQIQREIVAILDKFDAYCNSMTAGLAGELEMRRKQYRYWANALIMEGNVQMVKLGSICKICKGQQLNKDDYTEGTYPVWNMGAEPSGTHDTYNRDVPTIVIAGHGNSVGTVNWVDEPFWAGGGCYYLDGFAEDVNDRYLFHAMKVRERSLMGLASDGPIRHLYPKTIARAQVPVPVSASGTGAWDAARQQFICDILDKLCELERELELRRKQYGYYRDMLLAFSEKKGA